MFFVHFGAVRFHSSHFTRVAGKVGEWGEEVWAASLDLEKPFDKVLHSSVFDSLSETGVEADVVRALWRLCTNQKAQVCIDGGIRSKCIHFTGVDFSLC